MRQIASSALTFQVTAGNRIDCDLSFCLVTRFSFFAIAPPCSHEQRERKRPRSDVFPHCDASFRAVGKLRIRQGESVNYAYDLSYRLTAETIRSITAGPNGSVSYTYDAVGNRTQASSCIANYSMRSAKIPTSRA